MDPISYDLRPFLQDVETIISRHYLSKINIGFPGSYSRWSFSQGRSQEETEINPYGCADAANLLYTLNHFPRRLDQRRSWIKVLQSLQNPSDGLFHEATHHPVHTTAHCIAALELFDASPLYPLLALEDLRQAEKMEAYLEDLDWEASPWNASHRGAGLYAAMVLAGEVSPVWRQRYFSWLWDNADPDTGLFRTGCINPLPAGGVVSIFPHLAGTFHYLFNLQYARLPLRYPQALVDTCLELFHEKTYPLGNAVGFAEIDWVFCLNRAVRQSGHRFAEARQALADFAAVYVPYLFSLDPHTDTGLDDMHSLFGALCCLAELQQTLPGILLTDLPLRLVLDRRPFI